MLAGWLAGRHGGITGASERARTVGSGARERRAESDQEGKEASKRGSGQPVRADRHSEEEPERGTGRDPITKLTEVPFAARASSSVLFIGGCFSGL